MAAGLPNTHKALGLNPALHGGGKNRKDIKVTHMIEHQDNQRATMTTSCPSRKLEETHILTRNMETQERLTEKDTYD